MAQTGHEACIVVDDLSRGTQAGKIAKIVLEELEVGGITKEHTRFVCALGTHAPHTRAHLVAKLGKEIVENYMVYNHNCFDSCVNIGTNSKGDPVEVNMEFMSCDIKIGIGACTPHVMNGYGGGGKLLFPGIASIKTTALNHSRREWLPIGTLEKCGMRQDIEEMTHMVGEFFKIDAVINSKTDTVALFAGDPIQEYYEAIKVVCDANAWEPIDEEKDVVIVNANAKYNECSLAVYMAQPAVKVGGDIVMVNFCPDGQVIHYLAGSFTHSKGSAGPNEKGKSYKAGRIIYYTPYPDMYSTTWFDEPNKVIFAKTWEEILTLLGNHGEQTTAAVLTDGSIGYFKRN